jgi:hypothetical protein
MAENCNLLFSVANPGCFIKDLDLTIFSSRIRIQKFFNPGSYSTCKLECKLIFFLAYYALTSKDLVIVKKIREPGSEIRDMEKFIPDLDPGYRG